MNPDAETRHDFIDNQKRAMLLRLFGKRLQELGLRRHYTHIPCHRFHDDTGNLVANLVKKFLNASNVIVLECKSIFREVCRNALAARLARGEHARTRLDEQTIAMTVVATFKLHNLVAAGKPASGTDSAHRRFGSAVHHANHLDARHKLHHEFRKFRFQTARSAKTKPVLRRFCNRVNHRVVSVPQKHWPPAAHVIDVIVAIDIIDVATFGASDKRRCGPHVTVCTNWAIHATRHERFRFCK